MLPAQGDGNFIKPINEFFKFIVNIMLPAQGDGNIKFSFFNP